MTLAIGLGADRHRHCAVGLEAHLGAFVGRPARGLEEAGNAQAAQLAARLRLDPPRLETLGVGARHCLVEIGQEVAGVDRDDAEGRLVREQRDQVLPPELGGITAELARRRFDRALDDVVGLGLAGAAIGIDRHGVGESATHIDGDRRDVVDAALRGRGGDNRGAGAVAREIRPEVGDHRHVECQEAAPGVERELGRGEDIAALGAGDELIGALGQPTHRTPELARGPQQQDPFGIEEVLGAEAAADVGRMELDALGRQLEDEFGELAADAVQALSGQFEIHRSSRWIVARDAGARLDRRHDDAVVHHRNLDHVRGAFHRFGDSGGITALDAERGIARRLIPDERRAGNERRSAIDDGGQRFVVDLDQLGCLARDLLAVGHDEGHRIADMAHTASRERRAGRHDQRRDGCHAGHRAEAREISRNINAMNAGKGASLRNVGPLDEGVSMRRAQDMAPQAIGTLDIGEVTAASGEEADILDAAD